MAGYNGLILRLTAIATTTQVVAATADAATKSVSTALSAQQRAIEEFRSSSVVGFLIDYYEQIVALGAGKNMLDLAKLEDIIRRFGGTKIDFNLLRNPGTSPGARKTSVSTSNGKATTDLSTAVAQGKMGW